MAEVLTENQRMLTGYLAAVGCSRVAVLYIVMELWDEEAVIRMLEFCRDNPKATEAELLEACSKIYSKYKDRIEALPEWGEEDEEEEEEEEMEE